MTSPLDRAYASIAGTLSALNSMATPSRSVSEGPEDLGEDLDYDGDDTLVNSEGQGAESVQDGYLNEVQLNNSDNWMDYFNNLNLSIHSDHTASGSRSVTPVPNFSSDFENNNSTDSDSEDTTLSWDAMFSYNQSVHSRWWGIEE